MCLFALRELCNMLNMDALLLPNDLPAKDLDLLQRAFDAMRRTTGLDAHVVAREAGAPGGHRGADAIAEVDLDGHPYRYAVELKHVDRFAAAPRHPRRPPHRVGRPKPAILRIINPAPVVVTRPRPRLLADLVLRQTKLKW